jgi:hypothetical protein|tara:strand:+ start:2936 stop:3454 length:519 start_codon:yes stop_codon:yes gene_type:complete
MAYPLFISRNDIIKNSPLQGAIDADALLPFARTAQDKYLKNLLGSVLFFYLQAQIEAGTVGSLSVFYQDLLDDHIKNTLIWYACVEYIPFSSVQFKSNGAVKQQSEQGIAPSKAEIDYLLQKAQENGDYYALRLQNYLISYSNQIPQYLATVGNQTQIYPDQTNQYFGGIQL